MNLEELENVIDMKEAMEILGVSRTTFYRQMKEGKITGRKVGGQWRFIREDIYQLLKKPGKEDIGEIENNLKLAIDTYKKLLLEENEIDENQLGDLIPFFGEEDEGETGRQKIESLAEQLTDLIILKAVMDRVSDIHIEPYGKKVRIRHRDTGTLFRLTELPGEILNSLVNKIKEISDCDPHTQGVAQDGKFNRVIGTERDIVCRVSIFPCIEGDSAILRVLDKNLSIPPVSELGLNPADARILLEKINSSSGLVIFTGPTGSGKTTAIYSCLQEIKSEKRNIVTVEDPVEISFDGMNQSRINPDKGYDFHKAVLAMLRNDADVMMIGEIRDEETALKVIQAAITGHLVFTALHANTASSALIRLCNLGVETFLINDAVSMIVACRIVRKICTHCKTEVKPDEALLKKMSLAGYFDGVPVYKGKGCKHCHGSGYKGTTGIYESLVPDKKLKDTLIHYPEPSEIEEAVQKCVPFDLRSEALRKVKEGITTLEEIYNILH